jgi:autotransporter translocation and assembly factor TamB
MTVTRSFGVGDLVGRGPKVIVIRRMDDPRASIDLNLDIEIEDALEVDSNVAKLSLEGGASVGGTLLAPRLSGSLRADGGTFSYFRNDFSIDEFTIDFIEAARRDPYIKLAGTAEVDSRSGELYTVTAGVDGYLNDAVPELTSVPVLSSADIMSLLTFGNTLGAMASGGYSTGSSGDNFSNLARGAFLSSAFGLAGKTLERLLHLDRVAIADAQPAAGEGVETDVTIGKDFGRRLRVNYTTSVGRLSNQRIEVSFELARRLWLETRTNPEGNHAVGLKLQIPFK